MYSFPVVEVDLEGFFVGDVEELFVGEVVTFLCAGGPGEVCFFEEGAGEILGDGFEIMELVEDLLPFADVGVVGLDDFFRFLFFLC